MARPAKEGLDYFPLDTGIDQDDKLLVPISKFGMEGFGVIIRLLAEIYKNSYFYQWGEREQYVFSNRVNVNINTVIGIVNECVKWGFFNQQCFEKYHILTSKGIQHRYIGASKRRKSITFIDAYILIDLQEESMKVSCPIIVVGLDGNRVNAYKNPDKCSIVSAESTQKEREKEKEIEKEIKDKDIVEKLDSIPFQAIIEHLNITCGTSYKHTTEETRRLIRARHRAGFQLQDFIQVINLKHMEWANDSKMRKYLRPQTLFGTKFESYLNQPAQSNHETKWDELEKEFRDD